MPFRSGEPMWLFNTLSVQAKPNENSLFYDYFFIAKGENVKKNYPKLENRQEIIGILSRVMLGMHL